MTVAIHGQGRLLTDPDRQVTGSQMMCEALLAEGVTVLFGYPGGAIMPFYDALPQYPLRHVLVRHEQGAAHAADGYARVTGRPGVCVSTSGPGATNLVTGLATAFMDSVPLVAITGQVATPFIGTDAFQETDVLGVTQAVTKHSFLVERVEELADTLHEAFRLARSGRPGPVLVDVPKDIQLQTVKAGRPRLRRVPRAAALPDATLFEQAARLLDEAKRPLIVAGHGVILARAWHELRGLAEKTDVPVVTTLLGISAFPESHPLSLGMPGMHGAVHVNRAITECDVMLAVGMRFDDRVTMKVSEFAPRARIVHVDVDPAEMGRVVTPTVPLVCDARTALQVLAARVAPAKHAQWRARIDGWRDPQDACRRVHAQGLPAPRAILAAIRHATRGEALVTTDVGQNQMWAARYFGFDMPNVHFTSGGLGTMGYALPAAMGVKVARPDAPVWAIAGDGGIQMNLQELGTLSHYGIEVKVAILNNGYLGMVRQWQQFFHGGNYSETPISSPDYEHLAAAYGLTGLRVERAGDVQAAVDMAMSTPGTVILDFAIASEANVFPLVAPGTGLGTMLTEAS